MLKRTDGIANSTSVLPTRRGVERATSFTCAATDEHATGTPGARKLPYPREGCCEPARTRLMRALSG